MKIELPHVGESVTEGTIARWLKQVGDQVEEYDPLVEVITDKVNMEIPSPVSGKLTSIVVSEGETVPMGTVIAEIEGPDEDQGPSSPTSEMHTAHPLEPSSGVLPADRIGTLLKDVAPVGPTGSGGVDSTQVESTDFEFPQTKTTSLSGSRRTTARYSPAVHRLASEHHIDLSRITGTGIGGRITRKDVEEKIRVKADIDTSKTLPSSDGDDHVSVSPIRRSIAEHMMKSATQIPHVWSLVEVDVSELVAHREAIKKDFRKLEGAPITYLAFVLKAVAKTLKDHRLLNSMWDNDHIVLKKRVNIGIAVGTVSGLVVPVIRDTDTKSISMIAKEIDNFTGKARGNKLSLKDVQDGTFTVNNTGALGSVASQPLINHPQAAILTTEAITERAVVVEGEITIRPMMNLVLGFDHRIMDGTDAGKFLQAVKRRLENVSGDTSI